MADEGAPEQLANLHLDEVTGERVRCVLALQLLKGFTTDSLQQSKSELKKRNKQRELEERKAKKATETPAKAPNPLAAAQKKKPEEEAELTPNVRGSRKRREESILTLYSNIMKYEAVRSGSGSLMVSILIPINSMQ